MSFWLTCNFLLITWLLTFGKSTNIFLSSKEYQWKACRRTTSTQQVLTGTLVSSQDFNVSDYCIPAQVPGTALNTLILNKTWNFTDPFYEDHLYYAPDINETGREFYTFFWRVELDSSLSTRVVENEYEWLHLRGINYRSTVYMDGMLLAEASSGTTSVEGMYQRSTYLLPQSGERHTGGERDTPSTPSLSPHSRQTTRVLALLIEPPPYPGSARAGGQGGSHELAKSTTMQFSAGWDWIRGMNPS